MLLDLQWSMFLLRPLWGSTCVCVCVMFVHVSMLDAAMFPTSMQDATLHSLKLIAIPPSSGRQRLSEVGISFVFIVAAHCLLMQGLF